MTRRMILSTLLGVLMIGAVAAHADDAAKPYGDLGDFKFQKPEDARDCPSVPPPPGAIVLFDGRSLDKWVQAHHPDKTPLWTLLPDGVVQVRGGDMATKQHFDGHFMLHVEFRVPYMPKATGQGRGNSGVYLQGRYEVQVLDSYGLKSQDNDCGGIYKVATPLVNACKAPTVWQCYDIDFRAPEFEGGKKVAPARISVIQNGLSIHKGVPIPIDNTVSGLGGDPSKPGPIMLQDHGNPVQYRNIWLVPKAD